MLVVDDHDQAAGAEGVPSGLSPSVPDQTSTTAKPRVIVTTDPEKDDTNSLIRYLLYSDWFDTEGLVVASSQFHWSGDGKGTRWWGDGREYTRFSFGDPCPCTEWRWPTGPDHIQQALDAYAQVYPNLKAHDRNYPTPDQLRATYRVGNIAFDGDMSADTPGSDLIKQVLLDDEPGPVFLLAWGGQSTIARALQSIQLQYQHTRQWPAIYQKVSRKAIIQASGDQDNTGVKYITPNWPDIRHGATGAGEPGGGLGYGAQDSATPANKPFYSPEWIKANITDRGPLGALYYTWGDGRQMVSGDVTDYMWLSGYTADQLRAMGYFVWTRPQEKGAFLGEGDTPTVLNLLGNGMRQYEDTTWGTYGGGRYFPYLMNEEAARLQWSVTPDHGAANHAPTVTVEGSLNRTARPGQTLRLDSHASDPDGDRLSYLWYEESGVDTYPGTVTLSTPTTSSTSVTVPSDARPGQTIHVIVQVTDDHSPTLARYQRLVITVR